MADQDLKEKEEQWHAERTTMAKQRADKEYKYVHDAEQIRTNAEKYVEFLKNISELLYSKAISQFGY